MTLSDFYSHPDMLFRGYMGSTPILRTDFEVQPWFVKEKDDYIYFGLYGTQNAMLATMEVPRHTVVIACEQELP